MNEAAWYVAVNGQQTGPYTADDVTDWVRSGRFHPSALAWTEGQADWLPLGDLPEFASACAAGPAHPPAAAGSPPLPGGPGDGTSVAFAVLSYVGALLGNPWALVALVPLLSKRDRFAFYHAKQALTLAIVSFIALLISMLLVLIVIGFFLFIAVAITAVVLAIIGIVNAASGNMKPLPIVGGMEPLFFGSLTIDGQPSPR